MLTPEVLRAIVDVVKDAEQHMLERTRGQRDSQEPEMTASLINAIEILSNPIDGVTVEFRVLASSGPRSEESLRGADIEGHVSLDLGGYNVRKGFLVQSKRSGRDGLRLVETEASHWLFDGALELNESAAVRGRPSKSLAGQCALMLQESVASFVWVFSDAQIGVVSASAVRAARNSRALPTDIRFGTKNLADFFVHVAQSFLGDESLLEPPALTPSAPTADRQRVRLELSVTDHRRLARG